MSGDFTAASFFSIVMHCTNCTALNLLNIKSYTDTPMETTIMIIVRARNLVSTTLHNTTISTKYNIIAQCLAIF